MAATAYASLVSLLNTLDLIHTHPLVSTFFDTNQNNSLCEKVNIFIDFVEKHSDADSKEVEDLVRRIADAAHKAENVIEVHAADRVRAGESPSSLPDLQVIIEELESIEKEVNNVKEEIGKNPKVEVIKVKEETGQSPSVLSDPPPSSSSSAPPTAEAITMVGFDDYTEKLFWDLTGCDKDHKVIPITGMGGAGKTTLARNLFENPNVMRYFNVRVWVTVSQDSSARKVFLQALSRLGGSSINTDTADEQQLSVALHQALFNRRYLIVLDDVWSVEIWKKIKHFFPEKENGSRVVVTTRERKLVDHIGTPPVVVNLLDDENSWKLFCKKTFPRQDFPIALKKVAKKIVKKCGGLPLAISVIGGLLGKSPRMEKYWKNVAEDKSLIINLEENKHLKILYLSYKYLPVCLKSCFLYLGLYPEDADVDVDTLIKLWVAEGFIKANSTQSLEEVGESYINELVHRNLLLLRSGGPKWKSCSIHDLIRDLCIKIGKEESFYFVQRSIDGDRYFIADQRTARSYPIEFHVSKTPSIFHTLMVPVGKRAALHKTRLLRVFCSDDERSPYYAVQEVNIRFLQDLSSKQHGNLLPTLISRFWGLQTLIIETSKGFVAPTEIWKMPQLRHINISQLYLPDPPPSLSDEDVCVLQNLQTLKTVQNLIFTKDVCMRIPNIKKLHFFTWQSEAWSCYHLENLGCFNKLECLNYQCILYEPAGDLLRNIKFPSSLKELTLEGCKLEWSYMAVIALLLFLETLHLEMDAIVATEWIFTNEEFISLKRLDISSCRHVTKWIADISNFPVLEDLSVMHLPQLNKIPSGIGEIINLQSISLSGCSKSANFSAVMILHEQENCENFGLRVDIQTNEPELLRGKIQQCLEFEFKNLVIRCESYLISPS